MFRALSVKAEHGPTELRLMASRCDARGGFEGDPRALIRDLPVSAAPTGTLVAVMADPSMKIRQEAAVELAAIYSRHEQETAAFFEGFRKRLRVLGLTEEQIFDEVMELIRACPS
jgi:hypothetical protein